MERVGKIFKIVSNLIRIQTFIVLSSHFCLSCEFAYIFQSPWLCLVLVLILYIAYFLCVKYDTKNWTHKFSNYLSLKNQRFTTIRLQTNIKGLYKYMLFVKTFRNSYFEDPKSQISFLQNMRIKLRAKNLHNVWNTLV